MNLPRLQLFPQQSPLRNICLSSPIFVDKKSFTFRKYMSPKIIKRVNLIIYIYLLIGLSCLTIGFSVNLSMDVEIIDRSEEVTACREISSKFNLYLNNKVTQVITVCSSNQLINLYFTCDLFF